MLNGRLNDADAFFAEAMYLSPRYYELAGKNAQRVEMLKKDRTASR
jgi:hypothetical protein